MIEPRQHGYFKIHNASIYFRVYGKGERTLFFLHGNSEDWSVYKKQIEYFAEDYQIVTMDSRGHGHSGVSDKPLTIKQMARDTALLIKKLQLDRVTLIGFSDGGNIALEMAVNELIPLEGMVLAGANLNPRGVKFQYQLPIILGHAFCKMLSKFSPKLKRKTEILGLMTREPNIPVAQLKNIFIPVLVLAGEKDIIKEKHTKRIAGGLPGTTLAIIPGANHFLFDIWADKVNPLIKKFLAGDS